VTGLINLEPSREKLHDQITTHIQDLIIKNSLKVGDKLPGERDLANNLGVSRTVVREAIRTLSVRGLVEVQQGNGTFIKQLTPLSAAEPIKLLLRMRNDRDQFKDLLEIRRLLEVEIAGLAAERATKENITKLEEILRQQQANINNEEKFTRFDLAFHDTLIEATQNDLFQVLLAPITNLLLDFRIAAYFFDQTKSVKGGLKYHQNIYERICARDVTGACNAMRKHLEQAEAVFSELHESDIQSKTLDV